MLTAGEVANLYAPDELVAVRDAVRADVKAAGLPELNDTMWAVFIERVRAHLHICLCMSPVGNTFRDYVRMFPALVSCTTIDWFSDWPAEALKEVASRLLLRRHCHSDASLHLDSSSRATCRWRRASSRTLQSSRTTCPACSQPSPSRRPR